MTEFTPPPPPPPPGAPMSTWAPPLPHTLNQPAGGVFGRVFPSIGGSIGAIAIYFGLQVVFSIVAIGVVAVTNRDLRDALGSGDSARVSDAMTSQSAALLLAIVLSGVLCLAILWLQLRKDRRHQLVGLSTSNRWTRGRTVAVMVVGLIGVSLINAAYGRWVLHGSDAQAQTRSMVNGLAGRWAELIGFLAIVLVAPVLEELLFRGYLQTALSRKMKPWLAIAISSFAFGAVHLQPAAFPMLALIGALFGYLRYRTGTLRYDMILHGFNNGFAFLALLASR